MECALCGGQPGCRRGGRTSVRWDAVWDPCVVATPISCLYTPVYLITRHECHRVSVCEKYAKVARMPSSLASNTKVPAAAHCLPPVQVVQMYNFARRHRRTQSRRQRYARIPADAIICRGHYQTAGSPPAHRLCLGDVALHRLNRMYRAADQHRPGNKPAGWWRCC
jgi:hypothetical protein